MSRWPNYSWKDGASPNTSGISRKTISVDAIGLACREHFSRRAELVELSQQNPGLDVHLMIHVTIHPRQVLEYPPAIIGFNGTATVSVNQRIDMIDAGTASAPPASTPPPDETPN